AGVSLASDQSVPAEACQMLVLPLRASNTGNVPDVLDLTYTSSNSWTWSLYLDADVSGTLTPGDVPVTDTDGDFIPDTGTLAARQEMALLAVVTVPAPGGVTETATFTATSSNDVTVQATAVLTVQAALLDVTITSGPDGLCPGSPVQL